MFLFSIGMHQKKVIQTIQGRKMETEGQWTTVVRRRGREPRSPRWEDLISIFMDSLPETVSMDRLRSVFSSFGRVANVFIPASGRRWKGRCFGFV